MYWVSGYDSHTRTFECGLYLGDIKETDLEKISLLASVNVISLDKQSAEHIEINTPDIDLFWLLVAQLPGLNQVRSIILYNRHRIQRTRDGREGWAIWEFRGPSVKESAPIGDTDAPAHDPIGPNFSDVIHAATTGDGAIDLRKIDELEGRFSHLPGKGPRCDVMGGPCACGAWH